jgi:ABC-type lipoprotein release transport system permease subunit
MSIRSAIARTAFETLRANPTHTLMSISGLVIGVAALVGVLSLADGMEDFARKQVNTTTDLQSINVSVRTNEIVDGVSIQRPQIASRRCHSTRINYLMMAPSSPEDCMIDKAPSLPSAINTIP